SRGDRKADIGPNRRRERVLELDLVTVPRHTLPGQDDVPPIVGRGARNAEWRQRRRVVGIDQEGFDAVVRVEGEYIIVADTRRTLPAKKRFGIRGGKKLLVSHNRPASQIPTRFLAGRLRRL